MAAGDGAQLPAAVAASRGVEKALEEAAASGALNLSSRKLKEFPRSAKNYDLSDVTHADLSKNRLCELPEELCHFISLETLSLYHNGMRSLSCSLGNLQALTYLNLSRNLLSSLPPSVFQLPLLRVLIISNNKLNSLPAEIYSLTHLRQLDVSCNELPCLPAELGQLESLRDLNLRRNQLAALPEEIAELPLVRLDVSCNRISRVPLCYRHLRQLQSISLDNNPLLMPPAHVCSKGKVHIFKFLNMEACRRSQEELERHLRPTTFTSCLSDQELFSGQFSGLDSGFNSVDSGSKRWSGNESADDFSERSLRLAELSRDQRNLEEQEEQEEQDGSPLEASKVNREADQVDFIDSSVTEEGDDSPSPPLSAPPLSAPPLSAPPLEQKQKSSPSQMQESTICRSSLHVDITPSSSPSGPAPCSPSGPAPCSPSGPAPCSPSLEERRRPGTLLIWQERERQHQRDKSSFLKSPPRTGSHVTSAPQTGSSSGGPAETCSSSGLRHRCASADQVTSMAPPTGVQRSSSRTDFLKSSLPADQTPKPNSFLFRTSSTSSCSSSSSSRTRPTVFSLGESGRSESRTTLRSPKEEQPDLLQLRQTLESRLHVSLPDDLGEALSNGTILCQLANQIRPRSVSIIHVPSPAVPKLSSAKCRLNVENFISACRRLGVPERDVCVFSDVFLCKLPAVLRCITALLAVEEESSSSSTSSSSSSCSSSSTSSCSSSLLSSGFLLFYVSIMLLLYLLHHGLLS